MAEILLSVSPEVLRQTSMEMMETLRGVRLRAARIRDISSGTLGYWQGDSGEQDRAGYRMRTEELLEAARRLENRSVALMKLAGVYQEMEQDIKGFNKSLNPETLLTL